jgi:hypothetical protein
MENKFKENKAKSISELQRHIHQLLPGDVNASSVQQPSANSASPLSPIHRSSESLPDKDVALNEEINKFTDETFRRNCRVYIHEKSASHPETGRFPDKISINPSCGGVEKVFKTLVRQSPLGSNEQVQGSFGRNGSIKVLVLLYPTNGKFYQLLLWREVQETTDRFIQSGTFQRYAP